MEAIFSGQMARKFHKHSLYMLDVINHHGRQRGCAAFSENCSQGGWGVIQYRPTSFYYLSHLFQMRRVNWVWRGKLLHGRCLFFKMATGFSERRGFSLKTKQKKNKSSGTDAQFIYQNILTLKGSHSSIHNQKQQLHKVGTFRRAV